MNHQKEEHEIVYVVKFDHIYSPFLSFISIYNLVYEPILKNVDNSSLDNYVSF